uniref:Acyl_transf_3 domain-containing protein n=1 Tax=Bursaphelenchus xylophilus TaxID=6326 RepID=A0A1I7RVD8_BURXY
MKFRSDIQGLRAIAMIFVLIYHIWPEILPMGYLGVDIFLVISGYLITSILSSQEISCKTIATFFFRRLRRILLPYLSLTSLFLWASLYLISPAEYPQIIWDSYTVIFYWANIAPIFLTEGYFTLLHRWKFLLHLWSVCLELQFYLIAPLFVVLLNNLSKTYRYFTLLFLMITSFSLQICSSETLSHGFLHCRLWQFLCGVTVFYFVGLYLLLSSIVVGALFDELFGKVLQRIIKFWHLILAVTLLYGAILLLTCYMSSLDIVKISTQSFDKSRITKFQELPFDLYKETSYTMKDVNKVQEENAIMEIFTFMDIKCDDKRKWFDTKEDIGGLEEIEFICHDKGKGSKSMLVIGNSHAAVLYNGVRYHFKDVYAELSLISVVYCMPFLSHVEPRHRERCIRHQEQMKKMIATSHTKYDVIILAIQ